MSLSFKNFVRTTALVVVCCTALGLSASGASASPWDPNFGERGTLRVSKLDGVPGQTPVMCEFTGPRRLSIAGRFGIQDSLPTIWMRGNRLATSTVRLPTRRQAVTRARWHTQPLTARETPFGFDFAPSGSFSYARTTSSSSPQQTYVIRKSRADGAYDRRFGRKGAVTVSFDNPAGTGLNLLVRTLSLSDGGVLVVRRDVGSITLLRLNRDGVPAAWGDRGRVTLPALSTYLPLPSSAYLPLIETPEGGLLVQSTSGGKPSVAKLSRGGAIDTSFGVAGHLIPQAAVEPSVNQKAEPTQVADISVAKTGEIALLVSANVSHELGVTLNYFAEVVTTDGRPRSTSPLLGSNSYGGDDGFPAAEPLGFGMTAQGLLFGFASSYHGHSAGTYRGAAVRWRPGDQVLAKSVRVSTGDGGFAADDFAVSPDGRYLYACGSVGQQKFKGTITKQRKAIAIRRVKL